MACIFVHMLGSYAGFRFPGHRLGSLVRNAEQMVPHNFPLMRFAIAASLATTIAALSRKYFEGAALK